MDLQTRSAVAVASFVDFCTTHNIAQPPDKIVKNLCTFLCQDAEQTPTFAFMRKQTDGILSFSTSTDIPPPAQGRSAKEPIKDSQPDPIKVEEARKARLSRRGACLAFTQLSATFGPRLLEVIPNMWQFMAGGLLSAFQSGLLDFLFSSFTYSNYCGLESAQKADVLIEKQYGQDVIDSLSVLEAVAPTFHEKLWSNLAQTFPMMDLAIRSRFAIIRQSAARCFATICDVMTTDAMRYVIEHLVPLLGDPLVLSNRQGAIELIYRSCDLDSSVVQNISHSNILVQISCNGWILKPSLM